MPELIKPELPGGFQDFLPKEQIKRVQILRKIEEVYQLFGFVPLDTPEIEKWSVLTGNESTEMRIYQVALPGGKTTDEILSLRFDLTVPLARVVAAYGKDLPKPFKRYQLGRVFRGESSQKGRYNGFYQFDIDTVYSSSILSDAEIVAVIWNAFKVLGIERVLIRINNRKILNGLAETVGIKGREHILFRIMDKLEKIGPEQVIQELKRQPENPFDDSALALNETQIELIKKFLALSGESDSLSAVENLFGDKTQIGQEGIKETKQLALFAANLGVPPEKVKVDLSVARGLGYYTGPVFETTLLDLPSIGSVFSGGRYDGLVGRFSKTSVSATGASLGVDRLFAALDELKLLSGFRGAKTAVLIAVFDQAYLNQYLNLADKLRQADIATEVYVGDEKTLKAQLAYALKQEIPLLAIAGSNEFNKGVWQVKDLDVRLQKEVPQDQIVSYLKEQTRSKT